MKLLVNQVVQRTNLAAVGENETLRIVWIDSDGFGAYVVDIDSKEAMPVWIELIDLETVIAEGRAIVLKEDPLSSQLLQAREAGEIEKNKKKEEEYESLFERRDKAWKIIQPLVEDVLGLIFQKQHRARLMREAAALGGVHKNTVRKYLLTYWRFGHKDALIPFYFRSGGKGNTRTSSSEKRGRPSRKSKIIGTQTGVNIDAERKEVMIRGLVKYHKKQGLPFKTAFELMLDESFKVVGLQPTLGQASYWYRKQFSVIARTAARVGQKQFNQRYRSLSGISTDIAFGPGSLFQIDATIGDIYLVSSLDRSRIIGRPVIYVIVDTFSRLVVGFYVGLEGPSWTGAMLALEHAFTDKDAFLTRYQLGDLKDAWVGPLLPQAVLADRGELLSDHALGMIKELDVSVSNTAPYRPDWKGIVERRFKLIDDEVITWLPGAIRKLPGERKTGNPDDARLDIHEFRMILAHMFNYFNLSHELEAYPLSSDMLEQQTKPIPMQLWRWGIRYRSGKLHYQPQDMVRARLLPEAEASVTRDGIMFNKLAYSSPRERREHWTSRARIDKTWRVKVAYDKRTTDWIYLLQDGLLEIATLKKSHKGYEGRDWFEVEDYMAKVALDKEEGLPEKRAAKRKMQQSIDTITEKANRLTEKNSTRLRKPSVKQSREDMREQLRAEESWRPATSSEPEPLNEKTDPLVADSDTLEQVKRTLEEQDLDIVDELRRQAGGEDDE